MAAYIEVNTRGGRRAVIEAGSIAGVVTSPGMGREERSTPERPIRVILRVGETLDVIGESVFTLLARAYDAKTSLKERVRNGDADIWVDWLDTAEVSDDQDDVQK